MEIKILTVYVITYRPQTTRPPLGGTNPLKNIPPLKFKKSVALENYSSFKFSRNFRGFIPWVFQPEIFNLNLLGHSLQVTCTVVYSVKEVGQMQINW